MELHENNKHEYSLYLFEQDMNNRIEGIKKQLQELHELPIDKPNNLKSNIGNLLKTKKTILNDFKVNKHVEKMFDIKELCSSLEHDNIVTYEQLVDLFNIGSGSINHQPFRLFIIELGFTNNPECYRFSWKQVAEIILTYKHNTTLKSVLNEYNIYAEKNTNIINKVLSTSH